MSSRSTTGQKRGSVEWTCTLAADATTHMKCGCIAGGRKCQDLERLQCCVKRAEQCHCARKLSWSGNDEYCFTSKGCSASSCNRVCLFPDLDKERLFPPVHVLRIFIRTTRSACATMASACGYSVATAIEPRKATPDRRRIDSLSAAPDKMRIRSKVIVNIVIIIHQVAHPVNPARCSFCRPHSNPYHPAMCVPCIYPTNAIYCVLLCITPAAQALRHTTAMAPTRVSSAELCVPPDTRCIGPAQLTPILFASSLFWAQLLSALLRMNLRYAASGAALCR